MKHDSMCATEHDSSDILDQFGAYKAIFAVSCCVFTIPCGRTVLQNCRARKSVGPGMSWSCNNSAVDPFSIAFSKARSHLTC